MLNNSPNANPFASAAIIRRINKLINQRRTKIRGLNEYEITELLSSNKFDRFFNETYL